MAEETEKTNFNWRPILRNVLTLVFIIALIFLLYKLGMVSLFILAGLILSLIARPIYNQLEKINFGKFKIPSAVNAIISILAIWAILGGIGAGIFPIISSEVSKIAKVDPEKIITQLQEPINKGIKQLEDLGVLKFVDSTQALPERVIEKTIIYKIPCDSNFNKGGYYELLADTITKKIPTTEMVSKNDSSSLSGIRHRKELESQLKKVWTNYFNYGKMKKWFGSAFSLLGHMLAIFASASFLAFFFLRDKKLFMNMVTALVPSKFETQTVAVMNESRKMLSRYFIGLLIDMLIVMVCTTIGLLIVGLRFDLALAIGFFFGFFNVVPYVGPLIGAAFGLLLGISNHIEMDFYLVIVPLLIKMGIVFVIVHVVDSNVFQTIIYSSTVNAHPIEIFVVIVLAGNIAGITGMVLAIPIYTLLRIIARQFFSNFKVVKSLTKNM